MHTTHTLHRLHASCLAGDISWILHQKVEIEYVSKWLLLLHFLRLSLSLFFIQSNPIILNVLNRIFHQKKSGPSILQFRRHFAEFEVPTWSSSSTIKSGIHRHVTLNDFTLLLILKSLFSSFTSSSSSSSIEWFLSVIISENWKLTVLYDLFLLPTSCQLNS